MGKVKEVRPIRGYLEVLFEGELIVNIGAAAQPSLKEGSKVDFIEWAPVDGIYQGKIRTEDGRLHYCWRV